MIIVVNIPNNAMYLDIKDVSDILDVKGVSTAQIKQ